MGLAKAEYMRMLERGWHTVGNKRICSNCVEDYALKAFIEESDAQARCDYCHKNPHGIVESDVLLELIAQGLYTEYEDPSNSVGWCSADGGWLFPTTDSYNLLADLGLGNFYEDAAQAFSGHEWVECDRGRPWEYQLSRWAKFCDYVKHNRRFFFLASDETKPNRSLADILDYIGRVVTEVEMIETLGRGSYLYRARQHTETLQITAADIRELATPTGNLAVTSNRLSPAGIPMFYAATDAETARLETVTLNPKGMVMSVGRFEITLDLRVLNLAEIRDVPSLFDEDNRRLRERLKFMHSFADDLSQPIERDGREHIEYVPTQIVSEFFRLRFSDKFGAIHGIRYGSSKRDQGVCVCLFLTNQDFLKEDSKPPLRLLDVRRIAL